MSSYEDPTRILLGCYEEATRDWHTSLALLREYGEDATRMLLGCYEETAPVEFSLY